MRLKSIFAAATLGLGLTAAQAYAESEGAGDPFAFRAPPMVSTGHPFAAEAGSEPYPLLTGEVTQPESVTEMSPGLGSEAPIQSLASLPRGFYEGTPDFARAQIQQRYADADTARRLAGR